MSEETTKPESELPEEKAEVEPPEAAKEVEEPVEAEEAEEEIEIVEEKFFTVNLRDAWATPRKKRAKKTVKILKDFVKRNMKVEDFKISGGINEAIWKRSLQKPPRKLKIRAVKDKEGNVIVFPVKAA